MPMQDDEILGPYFLACQEDRTPPESKPRRRHKT